MNIGERNKMKRCELISAGKKMQMKELLAKY